MNYWNKEEKKTTINQVIETKESEKQILSQKKGSVQQLKSKEKPEKKFESNRFVNGTNKKPSKGKKGKKIKKSLQYLLLLKKYNHKIDFKNIKLLRAFLTKFGKIRPRRKTRLPIQTHRLIAKAIRKARAFQLIPFTFDVQV